MKKINLLTPDVHIGYLGTRKKESVRYLSLPPKLNMKMIKDDIKTGKIIFQGLINQLKKTPCKTVVIRTNSQEVGFMAVSYLASAYNRIDLGTETFSDNTEELVTEENPFEDFEMEEGYNEADYENFLDAYGNESAEWEENPLSIPIVHIADIQTFSEPSAFNDFSERSFYIQGNGRTYPKDPYWTNCTHEPICIECESGLFVNPYINFSANVGRYFQNNRHLYIVEIMDNISKEMQNYGLTDDDLSVENEEFVKMVLEEAAAVVDLFYDDKNEEIIRFRKIQFENWIERKGLTLSEEFPTEKIVSRILKMRNPNKSELMGQILTYMQVQENVKGEVSEKDFDILSRFSKIAVELKSEESSSKKMEKQLFGMEKVKRQVEQIVEVQRYQKRRENFGLNKGEYHNVHLLIGAPGTAKTTVAKLMGNMMAEAHLLSGDRFTCVNGADLKALYVGHTAPKVRQLFADNDIIMIDEAYSLVCKGESDSFSQEAISTLITQIEEHGSEKLVLFAGYGGMDVAPEDNLMKNFIDSNPGLKSRINSTIYFESYTPEQMVEIVHIQAKNQGFILNRRTDSDILDYFKERVKERDFGNGREARSLLENASVFAAERVKEIPLGKIKKRQLQELTVSDVRNALERMREGNRTQNGRNNERKIGFARGC